MSIFKNIAVSPPDPIFGVANAFNASKLTKKHLLAVGVYRTEEGQPFVFPAVKEAERRMVDKYFKDYLPMTGHPGFIEKARKLLWGPVLSEVGDRISTVQSCAGTGALYNVAKFTQIHFNIPTVLVSNPTWANYMTVFGGCNHKIQFIPWVKDLHFDVAGCVDGLKKAPKGSLAILQACAHNPTGIDPSDSEWDEILEVAKQREHIVLFDFAYMGYASGDVNKDCQVVRKYAKSGMPFFVSFSFSKCMGLYGERIGSLHTITGSAKEAKAVSSQMGTVARGSYSVPPQHGALIVNEVLGDPKLKQQWLSELKSISKRIIDIRGTFVDLLNEKSGKDWEFIRKQRGMFALTGLSKSQVDYLSNELGVFIPANGRISVPSLNHSNVEAVASAVAKASTH